MKKKPRRRCCICKCRKFKDRKCCICQTPALRTVRSAPRFTTRQASKPNNSSSILHRELFFIGVTVKALRLVKGITQKNLAESIGCSRGYLMRLEQNHTPSFMFFNPLASALGYTPNQLLRLIYSLPRLLPIAFIRRRKSKNRWRLRANVFFKKLEPVQTKLLRQIGVILNGEPAVRHYFLSAYSICLI